MKFRKKPVVVEAMKFTGANHKDIADFVDTNMTFDRMSDKIGIVTLEGEMTASKGDWIIKGVKGEFYPCKPDIFEKTYEPINEGIYLWH